MTDSDDISNLFRRFGGQADQYQELNRSNTARVARDRWPLLTALDASAGNATPPVAPTGLSAGYPGTARSPAARAPAVPMAAMATAVPSPPAPAPVPMPVPAPAPVTPPPAPAALAPGRRIPMPVEPLLSQPPAAAWVASAPVVPSDAGRNEPGPAGGAFGSAGLSFGRLVGDGGQPQRPAAPAEPAPPPEPVRAPMPAPRPENGELKGIFDRLAGNEQPAPEASSTPLSLLQRLGRL